VRVADTSALYALISDTDVHHAKALEAFSSPESIIIPAEIFGETIGLLHYRLGFPAARAAGDFIQQLPHTRLRASHLHQVTTAWETFLVARGKLSLPDAIVIAWCRAEAASPISFDETLLRHL
jgi:predicted nucleic acid-binding protein